MIGASKSSWLEAEDLEAVLSRAHAVSEKPSRCMSKTWSWRITGRSFFFGSFLEEVLLSEGTWRCSAEVGRIVEGWLIWRIWRKLCSWGGELFQRRALSAVLGADLFLQIIFVLEVVVAAASLFTESFFPAVDFSSRGDRRYSWIYIFPTAVFWLPPPSLGHRCYFLDLPLPPPSFPYSLVVVFGFALSLPYAKISPLATTFPVGRSDSFLSSLEFAHHVAFPFAQDSLVGAFLGMDHRMDDRCMGALLDWGSAGLFLGAQLEFYFSRTFLSFRECLRRSYVHRFARGSVLEYGSGRYASMRDARVHALLLFRHLFRTHHSGYILVAQGLYM
jgi:hypothetical protein